MLIDRSQANLKKRSMSDRPGFWKRLFAVPPGERSVSDVIFWWERRRFIYNALVLGIGFSSLIALYLLMSASGALKNGEDLEEPLAILAAPFLINICYTGGWIAELACRLVIRGDSETMRKMRRDIGPTLLALGLIFSGFVILFPTALALLTATVKAISRI